MGGHTVKKKSQRDVVYIQLVIVTDNQPDPADKISRGDIKMVHDESIVT